MVGEKNRGFTIIEVMLFLGISSVLFAVLIGGVSSNIAFQRYRDSVNSLVGVLQQQYSEVSNTRNTRAETWRCSGSTAVESVENSETRGTSECVILGRYVHTIDGGTKLEMGSVLGMAPPPSTVLESDLAALQAYVPRTATYDQETKRIEWDADLKTTDGHPSSFSLLILRSPLSGLVRSYALNGPLPANLSDMLTADAGAQKITACVASKDWVLGAKQAVLVNPAISGPNSISTAGDAAAC